MYSPTLLNTHPTRVICFLKHPDHNFYVWAYPDSIVHRNDEGLRSWQIMYCSFEHIEEYLDQYGTNLYKDLSLLSLSIDDLGSATPLAEPELSSPS